MLKQKTPLRAKTKLKQKTQLKAKTNLRQNAYLKTNKSIINSKKKHNSLNNDDCMFSKSNRIISQETINKAKRSTCEICGCFCNNEPHHIISRGAGGGDIFENLIQLCPTCHTLAHSGKFTKRKLFTIVARKLQITLEQLCEKNVLARKYL